jgi:hypothetical protein
MRSWREVGWVHVGCGWTAGASNVTGRDAGDGPDESDILIAMMALCAAKLRARETRIGPRPSAALWPVESAAPARRARITRSAPQR